MEWTIKQTSEKTGLSTDTLRYYDKEGILSPRRSQSGYRLYNDKDISSLKNLVVMKYAHFSLAEIKHMEDLFNREPSADCNEISKGILEAKITELRQIIYNYQKIAALMEELLPMIDSVESYQDNGELIDGFISQIFDGIRNDSLSLHSSSALSNRKEDQ